MLDSLNFDVESYAIEKNMIGTTAQKMKFSIKIYLVNVTKSEGNCGFGHIYWSNP